MLAVLLGSPTSTKPEKILTKAAHQFLTELADFPQKAIDPNWLESVEADGQQIKAEAEKAKRRRRRKTETMRRLRAKGKIALPFWRRERSRRSTFTRSETSWRRCRDFDPE